MSGPSNAANFYPEQPQRFYLPHEELEWLADATLVVEGVKLPVHSAMLSTQSGVLRGLFLDMQTIETGSEQGRKRKQPEEPVVLEQPFTNCRLKEVLPSCAAPTVGAAWLGCQLAACRACCAWPTGWMLQMFWTP